MTKTISRLRMRASAVGATAALATAMTAWAGGMAQAAPRPAETPLPGSAVPFTSHTTATGYVTGGQRLTVQLWLKPDAAAQRYATAVATPGDALFHHYLSPAGYTARFAASRATASRIESWLHGQGFTAISTDAGRTYVRATAKVSVINAAFGVRLALYKPSASVNAGRYPLRANNRPVSLPSTLADRVLGVSGLDNAAPVFPMIRENTGAAATRARQAKSTFPCSRYYGQRTVSGLPEHFGTATFPAKSCGYSAGQLRAAYGASDASTGQGQTIALVEQGLTRDMFLTLADYAKANHMPAPSATRYTELSLGKDSCGDPFDGEEQLDVESSYDMAPGAHLLVVGGDSCNNGDEGNQALFDADTAILDGADGHPLATIASNSWGSGDDDQPISYTRIENAYLVRAAAEGVGMYFSSGDVSGVQMPASDPYATAVGGTSLGIGKSGNRLFETGWSNGAYTLTTQHTWYFRGELAAAGGGPSLLWSEPAYQKGVVPAVLTRAPGTRRGAARSVPDISADADAASGGLAMGVLTFPQGGGAPVYSETDIGGTSLATPLVAGMVTAAQQGQPKPFGFINPVLYKLYGTDAYHGTLPLTRHSPVRYRGVALQCPPNTCRGDALVTFDDQDPHMSRYTGQVTLPGYDNMTGLGTPNGPAFIQHLRQLAG
jgi:subtilase family serine protease